MTLNNNSNKSSNKIFNLAFRMIQLTQKNKSNNNHYKNNKLILPESTTMMKLKKKMKKIKHLELVILLMNRITLALLKKMI